MKIETLGGNFAPIEPVIKQDGIEKVGATGVEAPGSFSEYFSQAIKEVNDLQVKADSEIEKLVLGKEEVSPHNAMIALEKADMAFQMMNAVRTKIIRAYEEVIRTQV